MSFTAHTLASHTANATVNINRDNDGLGRDIFLFFKCQDNQLGVLRKFHHKIIGNQNKTKENHTLKVYYSTKQYSGPTQYLAVTFRALQT